jgi:hypothetical protein
MTPDPDGSIPDIVAAALRLALAVRAARAETGRNRHTHVHDLDRAGLRHEHIERMHVVHRACGNKDVARAVATQTQ